MTSHDAPQLRSGQPCPTCGQYWERGNRSDELMRLLRVPVAGDSSHRRQVYRIHGTYFWGVTYSSSLPQFSRFTGSDVSRLVSAGRLVPVYPGTPAAAECYGLAEYYASPDYLRDIAGKIAQRDKRRGGSQKARPPLASALSDTGSEGEAEAPGGPK